jgi:hypothetical protein
MATLAVKPYRIAFRFYDRSNVLLHEQENETDGSRDFPVFPINGTFQLFDTVAGKKFIGTVSDVETYVETDNAHLVYRMYVTCKNSSAV